MLAGLVLLEALRENQLHAYLLASGGCWSFLVFVGLQAHHSNVCICLMSPFPLCFSSCLMSSLLIRVLVIRCRVYLVIPGWSHLYRLCSAKTLFLNQATCTGTGD